MLASTSTTTNSRFLGSPLSFPPRLTSSPSPSPPLSPTTTTHSRSPRVSAAYAAASPVLERRHHHPPTSLYDVLGIPAVATGQEIKAAYRSLALACHPDAAGPKSSSVEFMRVHAAYATLSDPSRRADYDRGLFRHRRPSPRPSPAAAAAYSRRTWETDQCW
ncbi:hypothetical protein QJS10_CPB11g01967 [Acorus calamus]|uniref:J domain-containing protein n=1 Tax=Acorus calamus TaxID=4465 RepID=A0AAV9DQL3_ACOCL|nr:hypothetical protein QJS10_CPB11g01967 [Acorus calamus]